MTSVKMFGDFFGKNDISHLENALSGIKHSENHIKSVLSSFNLNDYIMGISVEDVVAGLIQP